MKKIKILLMLEMGMEERLNFWEMRRDRFHWCEYERSRSTRSRIFFCAFDTEKAENLKQSIPNGLIVQDL